VHKQIQSSSDDRQEAQTMRRATVRHLLFAAILSTLLGSAGPRLAFAQDTPDAPTGLAVIGHGEATAPADVAVLQLSISSGNLGGPPVPEPAETQRQAVAPIVQALVDQGVAEDQISVIAGPYVNGYAGYYGPAIAVLTVAIDDPGAALLTDLVDAAATAADTERLVLGTVGAVFGLTDCSSITRDARQAAIDDARAQADTMATLLDVSLGDITAARDLPHEQQQASYGPYGPSQPTDPCGDIDAAIASAAGFNLPPFDPASEPSVRVEVDIELTFAVTGAAATPSA
jgi:uncharacterized protein YggE